MAYSYTKYWPIFCIEVNDIYSVAREHLGYKEPLTDEEIDKIAEDFEVLFNEEPIDWQSLLADSIDNILGAKGAKPMSLDKTMSIITNTRALLRIINDDAQWLYGGDSLLTDGERA